MQACNRAEIEGRRVKKRRMRRRAGSAMVDEEFGDDAANASHECLPPPVAQQQEQQCCRGRDASAVTPSQAVPVVGVPNFPNCVKWSEENLLAIGAGHLVTILDPASMSGPRGFVPVAASPVFDFGSVQPADLQAHSLFQLCLARDPRPGVRSIDWSPPGLAQNGGSFLAVCTTDSRVKLYRAPFCDFQSEWVEIIDLSEMIFNYCLNNDFREAKLAAARLAEEEETVTPPLKWGFKLKRKLSDDEEPRHRKVQKTKHHVTDKLVGGINFSVARAPPASMSCGVDEGQLAAQDPFVLDHTGGLSSDAESPSIEKGTRVEVLEEDDDVQYWVSGSVVEIVDGEALVRLDRSQYGAMEEWVPLHGQKAVSDDSDREETDQLSSGHGDGKKVIEIQRPRIRPEVAMCTLQKHITDEAGGERSLVSGELVEALINQRWQEGMVVELQGSGVVVDFSASSVNATVELNNLRLAPFWHGERWIWKTGSAVSNQRISPSHLCSNDSTFATTAASIGQEVPTNSTEKDVRQRHGEVESMRGTIKSGHFTTSNALDMEQDNPTSPALSGSEQDSRHDITQATREKSYSRVYKRRGLVTATGILVDSFDTEICTPRPIRSRRLPSKLRSENAVSWMTEPDGLLLLDYDAGHENLSQDKDGDYVQKMRGAKDVTKAKHGRFVKRADNVKQGKSIKDTVILKEAKRSKVGDKKNPENKEGGIKHNWISAHDFAARSEVLTPLALAWSSKYQDQFIDDGCEGQTAQCFVLLGAGMKSGRVSLWRMAFPPSYSIDHAHIPVTASFLGFLFAHDSWVNSLSWASCSNFDLGKLNAHDFPDGGSSSGDTLLLATGCADGSVKLWAALSRELAGSASVNNSVPFMYLTEVVNVDSVPVTALALFVPPRPGDRALLAVGKGSGSVGVWELKSSGVFRQICLQLLAHQQMVTGFSWTSDIRCLYSCGQDSLKRWDFSQDQLLPLSFPDGSAVFPSNTASDICSLETLESFFGVTLSPNGLALAAVRGIATDLLDQMYQARSQKGMVQLFWLGNEHIDIKKVNHSTMANISHSSKAMSGHDKACWELNIIEALEDLQDPRRTLVLWDVVATLSSLKEKLGAEGVVDILSKWLSSWTSGQGALGAVQSYDWSTGRFQKAIPEASCRRLQILNVIYRRVFLSRIKTEGLRAHTSEERDKEHDVGVKLWKDRMHLVEHDLRQRLVHINLQIATSDGNHLQDSAQSENSLEIQLLVEWVLTNAPLVVPQLVTVATQLRSTKENSVVNLDASSPMEACTFCDSTVPFESPEIATCFGPDSKHRLRRCSVSMQVCPPVCLWHCGCCGRSAINQASSLFFSLSSREKVTELSHPDLHHGDTFPSCPFCGILMHRLLPNFFLTPSLV